MGHPGQSLLARKSGEGGEKAEVRIMSQVGENG